MTMKYQSFKWTEFCPSLYERGEMVTIDDVPAMREKYGKEMPMFISRYLFDKASPYTGKVLSNFYADFDDADDPWRALVEMLDMAEQFVEMGVEEEHIKLRFTGGKGGTVEVPYQYFEAEPRDDLPQIWRGVAEWFARNWHYKTLDTSVYERRRLWRLTNTKHKSGRFKIPITIKELKDNKLEGIKELAKEFRPYTWVDDRAVEVTPIPKLIGLYKDGRKAVGKAKRKWKKDLERKYEPDGRIFPCVELLIQNGVDADEFQRNPTAFNIAVALQSLDVDGGQILEYLEEFARNCKPEFPLERYPELQHCIDSAMKHEYTTHCGTPCFESVCVKKKNCWVFKEPGEEEEVVVREEFTLEVVAKAEELLNSQTPLDFIATQALSQIFMEKKTKLTLFLLQLAWESARLSGETSTGKSHIADNVMECFPRHWWMKYTGATDKYIRYLPSSIRTIYFAEFAAVRIGGGEESTAEYDMKMIMSEGELKTGVVEKVDGKLTGTTREVRVQNFITTSTDVEMSPELRNRQWELSTDRNINYPFVQHYAKEQSRPPWERINPAVAQQIVRCALEKLDEEAPDEWWIPFASELDTIFKPLEMRTDSRRSIQKLFKLIKAMAKLHYRNRPIIEHEGTKYGIAMPEDFYNAWQIGDEAIIGTLTEMTQRVEVVWDCVVNITKAKKKLNSATLASAAGVNQDGAKKWLNRFEDMGLVAAIDRDAAGVQYRRTDGPSEDIEDTSSIEIPISSLYESLTSIVSTEYVEASRARVADKVIVLEYPSTIRKFSIDDLPDDIKTMAYGGSINIQRMGSGQLRVLRGMDKLRMSWYEDRYEAAGEYARDNIPDDYLPDEATWDEDVPEVIKDGIYDDVVKERIKTLFDDWSPAERQLFYKFLLEGLE